jgi:hypothetical protein
MRAGAEFLFYYQAWDRQPGIDNYWVASPGSVQENAEGIIRFRQAMWDTYSLLDDAERQGEFTKFMVDILEGEPEDAAALQLPDFFPRLATREDIDEHMMVMFERGDIDGLVDLRETSLFLMSDD